MNETAACLSGIAPLILQVAQVIERRLEEVLGRIDLSPPKFGALTQLVQTGEPLHLSELASRMTCVRSNITQLVDRLEADGLVRREEDPKDRRGVKAAITTAGRERQAAGAKIWMEFEEEVSKALAGIDRKILERALEAFR